MSIPSQYCIYLRKSRADMEAEAHGEGETLARHERMLLELSKRLNLNITQIYREIVSGETIAARPVMQHLLAEVGAGMWSGVLVVEVERLARGDTMDQGLMAQTFKYSGTKIVTPMRTYDPENEFDEEYFEFGLFMSRREYKTINRRLQRGRTAAAKEGKFVGGTPPLGYDRVRVSGDRGYMLQPNKDADLVRLIFKLYTEGAESRNYGTDFIAKHMDELGVPAPRGAAEWNGRTIAFILSNPAYIGKIRWGMKKRKRRIVDGSVKVCRVDAAAGEGVLVDGLHDAIISNEVFNAAQELLSHRGTAPIPRSTELKNSLSGLIVCGICGRHLRRTTSGTEYVTLRCPYKGCPTVGSYFASVEGRVLQMLSSWLDDEEMQSAESAFAALVAGKQEALDRANADLEALRVQLSRTHDLLEQGVYSIDVFLERSRLLTDRIASAEERVAAISGELGEDVERASSRRCFLPMVKRLIEEYDELSVGERNNRLKQILDRVEYSKPKRLDDFTLVLVPKIW